MKEVKKIVFKYDNINDIFLINDKECDKDTWIKVKSLWEVEQSYNHIKRYVDKWGFTDHDYCTENNIDSWVFTTVKNI